MPPVKNLAVSVWEIVVKDSVRLLNAAIKSLFYAPVFYGVNLLISHHAPSHDMWFGFAFAAALFTSVPTKADSRPSKEEPQQPSTAIILPASMTSSANPPR